ncbi:MAG: hypothetical protein CYPHOPRED_001587 [Cyphobasidiales sp. Tagirdzhanova-0007]|nr:MAG: hypothetical protein CYPHOPRED_001587 [Cyphobasidiales sp. Tagirdzhanova-0007]
MSANASPTASFATNEGASPRLSLSMDEIGRCNTAAQLEGTLYGTAAGFLGGFFSFRFLKQNKNISLFSGLATGVISGYVVSRTALQARLARAELDAAAAQRLKVEQKDGRWDLNRREGGFGGMEAFDDKYATTSGEH